MNPSLEVSLFDGDRIRLGPIERDADAEIESRWTHDAAFMRQMYFEPMRPLTPAQIRKSYEELEKEADEQRVRFPFRIRARDDDRLVGLADIFWVSWSNDCAWIRIGLGTEADRRKGFGREALSMLLRYAFDELNLHRLSANVPAHNEAAIALFHKAGFTQEVVRREALHRDGRYWDLLTYGLLAPHWRTSRGVQAMKGE
jgi:RimJ/RimL family protein N-acetyltransferase